MPAQWRTPWGHPDISGIYTNKDESGIPMEYVMLRGIFMPSGVSQDVVAFYVDLFKKVRGTAEWQKFMEDGAFNQSFMTGKEYAAWVANAENLHRQLMTDAGFIGRK